MSPYPRQPNLLLIGPDAVLGEYLDQVITSVASPVRFCDGAELEFTNDPVCSLIVRDVDRLARAAQQRLIEWMNRHDGDTRIIATSARPVFPSVERGEFSEALYYRINTVTIVLSEGPDPYRARATNSSVLDPVRGSCPMRPTAFTTSTGATTLLA